jgi:hypothetical protein
MRFKMLQALYLNGSQLISLTVSISYSYPATLYTTTNIPYTSSPKTHPSSHRCAHESIASNSLQLASYVANSDTSAPQTLHIKPRSKHSCLQHLRRRPNKKPLYRRVVTGLLTL